jgi:hypothetical protein
LAGSQEVTGSIPVSSTTALRAEFDLANGGRLAEKT